MAHPLLGANIATLARVFRDGGGADRRMTALGIWSAALGRLPFSTLERALVARRIRRGGELPPIFILGHWRSGTTHLYNLMSGAGFGYVPPIAAGLPWDMLLLARALRLLLERQLPGNRYIDDMRVTPTSPQEDEIALASMSPLSFYHGIYFPRAFDRLIDRGVFLDGSSEAEIAEWKKRFVYLLRKLALLNGGRPMLIKNPVYTARPAMLREIFPGAKFIHIHRNPYEVFISMRNFYSRLLKAFALQEVPGDLDIDATILRVYHRMMTRFETETVGWQAPDFVDISYEFLDREPLAALGHIYATLELEGFVGAVPGFSAHLAAVRGYRKNHFGADPEADHKVAGALGHWIEKWGYSMPAPLGTAT